MSLYDYRVSEEIYKKDYPFYALLMAVIRKADDVNLLKLRLAWPDIVKELQDRYYAPGGLLEGENEMCIL
jgi:hypothetical protein